MLTLNNIFQEIKDVPVNRLEELYQIVHSLTPYNDKSKAAEARKKKILSFSGTFSGMKSTDYDDVMNHIKETRTDLFDRNIG